MVCLISSFLADVGYATLIYLPTLTPLIGLSMLAISESFIPLVVMALVPSSVSPYQYGMAYGVVEVRSMREEYLLPVTVLLLRRLLLTAVAAVLLLQQLPKLLYDDSYSLPPPRPPPLLTSLPLLPFP